MSTVVHPAVADSALASEEMNGGGPASSAVSWSAVFAGAATCSASSLVLTVLAMGVGVLSVSSWPSRLTSTAEIAAKAAIALVIVQWVSAGLGGYVTGRLRTRWPGIHTHEVFFRDTAHGLLTWCLATLLAVGVLTSAGSVTGIAAADAAANGLESTALRQSEALLQADGSQVTGITDGARWDAEQVLLHRLQEPAQAAATDAGADRAYFTQLVKRLTGVTDEEAHRRVDLIMSSTDAEAARVRAAADKVREHAAGGSILLALSMLIGAFVASASAALGGRLRDLPA